MRALSRKRALAGAPLALAGCLVGAIASCGARTGLPTLEAEDAGSERVLSPDRFFVEEPGPDRREAEAEADVVEELPTIDTNRPDVPLSRFCPDAEATLIYVISKNNVLTARPECRRLHEHRDDGLPGQHAIPALLDGGRPGGGRLCHLRERVDVPRLRPLPRQHQDGGLHRHQYDPAANGNNVFGMGFVANVADGGDGGETLFVAPDINGLMANSALATIDTTTFVETTIGDFDPTVEAAELTGTGDGQLFAFSPAQNLDETSFIAQIDPATAMVIAEDTLPGIVQGAGWAFGFWGGDFYTFTTSSVTDTTTVVNQFNPTTKAITLVATLSDTIVGAGVSTCAPQN